MAIEATYTIGSADTIHKTGETTWSKVYDGTAIEGNAIGWTGIIVGDTKQYQLTNDYALHVGTVNPAMDAGYPKILRNGVDVTSEYNFTKIETSFIILERDITLQSATITKEYDGTALTADSQQGGTDITDLTAGVTDKGYVSGEEFTYSFTGSQLFVGESDNVFTVADSNTAQIGDYNETLQYGKLKVTGRTVPVTITVEDQEKLYDGTASFNTSAYTVSGELAYGDTITVTLSNDGVVDAGTYTDGITATYQIMHNNGNGTYTDVTDMYLDVTVDNGDFTINKRSVTFTSGSATKLHDGTPLTNSTVTVSGDGFVGTEGATYDVTGSQTVIGTSANTFTYALNEGTKAGNYDITKVEGTLTVTGWEQQVTITADSNSKMYDGNALTDTGYDIIGLAAGHTATVTTAGEITHFGTADNVVYSYTIYDENGADVTLAYTNVQTVSGTLEITKRSVTLTSDSDSWVYDGTAHTKANVTVSGDGFVGTEGATYSNFASITNVGTTANTFSYVLNNGTSADDYTIATANGTLEITERDVTITIGASLTTGLSFLYDNTNTKVLEEGQYVVSGLADGESLANVTITTNGSNAGTYDEDAYEVSFDIVNDTTGVSTKSNYNVTLNKNDVEITKRTITIAAGSDSKVYDGTALTCHTHTVVEGATEEYQLLGDETVSGVGFTADSTITHAGSTANRVDASNVTITKEDGSDSSMNYNIETVDGTLTVTQRGVMLISTSADKYYDGTALQNRQVIVTGFRYDENGNVVIDENAGFLAGDGCTYDFVGDNIVIDKDGNVIAWTVSEQSDTSYGQTEVGSSKNEFNYNNFTSVYSGSYESDYIIMNGFNQESLGLSKDVQDLFGDLTVWGGAVEINMTDYSWTYDYQAKTNGYFDDGYTVIVATDKEQTEAGKQITEVAHNSEGSAIALLGNDTIVVTVTGQGGSAETGKVQHVDNGDGSENKQNSATYTIYRNGVDVTSEVEEYYDISVSGGLLKITPRTVVISSASDSKVYDGTALTNNTVVEGSAGRDTGFIFGEGAAYEVTGSQTEYGTSKNSFAISELLTDTKATDYNFVLNEGTLTVTPEITGYVKGDLDGNGLADVIMTIDQAEHAYNGATGAWLIQEDLTASWGNLSNRQAGDVIFATGFSSNKATADVYVKTAGNVLGAWVTDATGAVTGWETVGAYNADTQILGLGDFNGDGQSDVLLSSAAGDVGIDFTSGKATGWNYIESLDSAWKIAGIGDLNADGLDDIVLKHDSGATRAWLVASDRSVSGSNLRTLDDDTEIVGCGDFNGDGTDDILLKQGSTYSAWLMKDGEVSSTMGLGDISGALEEIADFNGDGIDDLRIRTEAGDLGAMLVSSDELTWQYFGSVGDEWKTKLAAMC